MGFSGVMDKISKSAFDECGIALIDLCFEAQIQGLWKGLTIGVGWTEVADGVAVVGEGGNIMHLFCTAHRILVNVLLVEVNFKSATKHK